MRNHSRLFLFILVFVALALGPRAWDYAQSQGPVPAWVTLAGQPAAGSTLEEIAQVVRAPYAEPVWVYYGEERLLLRPEEVGFRVDVEAMLEEAQAQRQGLRFWRGFVDEVLHQTPEPVDIPLRYEVDEVALSDWLSDVAQRYDRPPTSATVAPIQEGIPFTRTVVFRPGEPGLRLDLQASAPRLVEALASPEPEKRQAWLVLEGAPPPPPDIALLEEVLRERMEQTPLLSSVFVRHLTSGQELSIRGDVAYSGMSMMKIPIFIELYRKLNDPPDAAVTKALTSTMTLPRLSNAYANQLLRLIGDGDAQRGAERVTQTVRRLGLINTFMAAPYAADVPPPHIVTPANSRSDFDAHPDPYMQTTPKEMGLLLEMIAKCAEGKGALLAAFPGELTPGECEEIIGLLELNPITTYIRAGLPEGTRLAHKHGFSNENQSDAGIIWGPGGPYVLSISVYQPYWVEYRYSHPLMADIAKATWDFFTLWASSPSNRF